MLSMLLIAFQIEVCRLQGVCQHVNYMWEVIANNNCILVINCVEKRNIMKLEHLASQTAIALICYVVGWRQPRLTL